MLNFFIVQQFCGNFVNSLAFSYKHKVGLCFFYYLCIKLSMCFSMLMEMLECDDENMLP